MINKIYYLKNKVINFFSMYIFMVVVLISNYFGKLKKIMNLKTLILLYILGGVICFGLAFKDSQQTQIKYYTSTEYELCVVSKKDSFKYRLDDCIYDNSTKNLSAIMKTIFWPLFISYKVYNN